ncbi:uncharacterized protein LOC106154916 [Lingula anatina]|uniref:Uncharacterized protein LOC106154916 n=1 Tax=Lingula anatina TaxID=7574 RepID=A0A1S3HFU4_LINAN|nr:uncharacterized protein LOC106154916 [Lingula anatina]|eukprot:XP_013384925.1 uncharacterized protein LOC106154916 [Lingula anatina]
MASQLTKEISDQFLVCKICLEPYKQPKTLDCLHVFCSDCIEKHMDAQMERTSYRYASYMRNVSCPLCRKRTDIPNGGVRKLPDNFLVSNLTEIVNRRKPSAVPLCDICHNLHSKNNEAASKCLECSKLLCKSCVDLHTRTKVTAHHSLCDVEVEKDIQCQSHPEEQIRFYCEPCQKCICVVCAFQEHKGHEVSSFNEGMQRYRDSLQTLVQSSKVRIEQIKSQLDFIDDCDNNKSEAEKAIREMTEIFVSRVRASENQLINQLNDMYGAELLEFLQKRNMLQDNLNGLQSTCNLTEILIQNQNIEMLLMKNDIQQKLESLLRSGVRTPPANAKKHISFIPGCVSLGHLSTDCDETELAEGRMALLPKGVTVDTQTPIITNSEQETSMGSSMIEVLSHDIHTQTLRRRQKDQATAPELPFTYTTGTMTAQAIVRSYGVVTDEPDFRHKRIQTEEFLERRQERRDRRNRDRSLSRVSHKETNTERTASHEKTTCTEIVEHSDQSTSTAVVTVDAWMSTAKIKTKDAQTESRPETEDKNVSIIPSSCHQKTMTDPVEPWDAGAKETVDAFTDMVSLPETIEVGTGTTPVECTDKYVDAYRGEQKDQNSMTTTCSVTNKKVGTIQRQLIEVGISMPPLRTAVAGVSTDDLPWPPRAATSDKGTLMDILPGFDQETVGVDVCTMTSPSVENKETSTDKLSLSEKAVMTPKPPRVHRKCGTTRVHTVETGIAMPKIVMVDQAVSAEIPPDKPPVSDQGTSTEVVSREIATETAMGAPVDKATGTNISMSDSSTETVGTCCVDIGVGDSVLIFTTDSSVGDASVFTQDTSVATVNAKTTDSATATPTLETKDAQTFTAPPVCYTKATATDILTGIDKLCQTPTVSTVETGTLVAAATKDAETFMPVTQSHDKETHTSVMITDSGVGDACVLSQDCATWTPIFHSDKETGMDLRLKDASTATTAPELRHFGTDSVIEVKDGSTSTERATTADVSTATPHITCAEKSAETYSTHLDVASISTMTKISTKDAASDSFPVSVANKATYVQVATRDTMVGDGNVLSHDKYTEAMVDTADGVTCTEAVGISDMATDAYRAVVVDTGTATEHAELTDKSCGSEIMFSEKFTGTETTESCDKQTGMEHRTYADKAIRAFPHMKHCKIGTKEKDLAHKETSTNVIIVDNGCGDGVIECKDATTTTTRPQYSDFGTGSNNVIATSKGTNTRRFRMVDKSIVCSMRPLTANSTTEMDVLQTAEVGVLTDKNNYVDKNVGSTISVVDFGQGDSTVYTASIYSQTQEIVVSTSDKGCEATVEMHNKNLGTPPTIQSDMSTTTRPIVTADRSTLTRQTSFIDKESDAFTIPMPSKQTGTDLPETFDKESNTDEIITDPEAELLMAKEIKAMVNGFQKDIGEHEKPSFSDKATSARVRTKSKSTTCDSEMNTSNEYTQTNGLEGREDKASSPIKFIYSNDDISLTREDSLEEISLLASVSSKVAMFDPNKVSSPEQGKVQHVHRRPDPPSTLDIGKSEKSTSTDVLFQVDQQTSPIGSPTDKLSFVMKVDKDVSKSLVLTRGKRGQTAQFTASVKKKQMVENSTMTDPLVFPSGFVYPSYEERDDKENVIPYTSKKFIQNRSVGTGTLPLSAEKLRDLDKSNHLITQSVSTQTALKKHRKADKCVGTDMQTYNGELTKCISKLKNVTQRLESPKQQPLARSQRLNINQLLSDSESMDSFSSGSSKGRGSLGEMEGHTKESLLVSPDHQDLQEGSPAQSSSLEHHTEQGQQSAASSSPSGPSSTTSSFARKKLHDMPESHSKDLERLQRLTMMLKDIEAYKKNTSDTSSHEGTHDISLDDSSSQGHHYPSQPQASTTSSVQDMSRISFKEMPTFKAKLGRYPRVSPELSRSPKPTEASPESRATEPAKCGPSEPDNATKDRRKALDDLQKMLSTIGTDDVAFGVQVPSANGTVAPSRHLPSHPPHASEDTELTTAEQDPLMTKHRAVPCVTYMVQDQPSQEQWERASPAETATSEANVSVDQKADKLPPALPPKPPLPRLGTTLSSAQMAAETKATPPRQKPRLPPRTYKPSSFSALGAPNQKDPGTPKQKSYQRSQTLSSPAEMLTPTDNQISQKKQPGVYDIRTPAVSPVKNTSITGKRAPWRRQTLGGPIAAPKPMETPRSRSETRIHHSQQENKPSPESVPMNKPLEGQFSNQPQFKPPLNVRQKATVHSPPFESPVLHSPKLSRKFMKEERQHQTLEIQEMITWVPKVVLHDEQYPV